MRRSILVLLLAGCAGDSEDGTTPAGACDEVVFDREGPFSGGDTTDVGEPPPAIYEVEVTCRADEIAAEASVVNADTVRLVVRISADEVLSVDLAAIDDTLWTGTAAYPAEGCVCADPDVYLQVVAEGPGGEETETLETSR